MSLSVAPAAAPLRVFLLMTAIWKAANVWLGKGAMQIIGGAGRGTFFSIRQEVPISLPTCPSPLPFQPALCLGRVGTRDTWGELIFSGFFWASLMWHPRSSALHHSEASWSRGSKARRQQLRWPLPQFVYHGIPSFVYHQDPSFWGPLRWFRMRQFRKAKPAGRPSGGQEEFSKG